MAGIMQRLSVLRCNYYGIKTNKTATNYTLLMKDPLPNNAIKSEFKVLSYHNKSLFSTWCNYATTLEITRPFPTNEQHLYIPRSSYLHTSSTLNAGRKFARERRKKKAIKNKALKEARLAKNPPPLPYKVQLMLAAKGLGGPPRAVREKDDKEFVADDVYFMEDCAWKRWKVSDAIYELRLNNHPSLGYSIPNGLVVAKVEFDLRGSKKDKYLDGYTKMVNIPHAYERGVPDRNVCALVPTSEMEEKALEAGAVQAGGEEFIKEITKGRIDLSEIDHFVAHEDISGSVNVLAGILRDKCPRIPDGTVGDDVPLMVSTFARGMHVNVKKVKPILGYQDEQDYGFCEATIGTLDMEVKHLEENLTSLLEKLNANRPKRKDKNDTNYITRCILKVKEKPGIGEEFSIQHDCVSDKRVEEQQKALNEGRQLIKERVIKLKELNV